MEPNAIKDKQQKTWASGNYAMIDNPLVIGRTALARVDVRDPGFSVVSSAGLFLLGL